MLEKKECYIEGERMVISDKSWAWMVVGIYVFFIYTTLSLIPTVIDYGRGIFHYWFSFFVTIVLLLLLTSYVFWLLFVKKVKRLSSWVLIFVVMVFYGYLLNVIRLPQERFHLVEYGLLALLVYRALNSDIRDERIYFYTTFLVMVFGFIDEFIQLLLPNRYYDIRDVLVNTVSGIMGALMLFAQDRN
jgi:hypothetical protein